MAAIQPVTYTAFRGATIRLGKSLPLLEPL